MKAQLDTEVTENRAKLEEDVNSLQAKAEKSSKDLKDALDTLSAEREELEVHRRSAEERSTTIVELKEEMVSLAAAAAEARTMREKFDEQLAVSKAELSEMTTNQDNALKSIDELNAKIETLKTELGEKDIIISALEDEKNTLLNDSVAPEEYLAMEEKAIRLEGEKNQSEKMTKSLQKDMKKVVKELQHQIWVVEEELNRSNERCDELRGVMTQMADDDLKRIEEEEQRKATSGIVGKMKAVRRMSTLGSGN